MDLENDGNEEEKTEKDSVGLQKTVKFLGKLSGLYEMKEKARKIRCGS
ncbi:uncharacterized protein G2W53_020398 [Senna tora]|uniref:Uncharacterized protein n=1 Tax=Senna tora TaxID=362788 RepID=A0A834WSC8_9FABA|nr:uncharacterized protein G2W53_020398 [Senna tora]